MDSIIGIVYYAFYQSNSDARISNLLRVLSAVKLHKIYLTVVTPASFQTEFLTSKLKSSNIEVVFVVHDNAGWEFGAYQKGLNLLRRSADIDGVIFINDTIGIKHYLPNTAINALLDFIYNIDNKIDPAIAGEIDQSRDQSFSIYGLSTNRWIRTSIFYLNTPALEALESELYFSQLFEDTTCIDGSIHNSNVSSQTLNYIYSWLSGTGIRSWHGANRYINGDSSFRAQKVAAVLSEKYLSALLDSKLVAFHNIVPTSFFKRLMYRLKRKYFFLFENHQR